MYGCACGKDTINHDRICHMCNARMDFESDVRTSYAVIQFIGLLWILAITVVVYQFLFSCFGSIDGAYQCASLVGEVQWTLVLKRICQSICQRVPGLLRWSWETARAIPWIEVFKYTYMAIYATGYLMVTICAVCVKGVLVVLGIVAN